ncbi:MAG: LuxR C-terminal-related transcriptional regulator [Gammaproteobacteria bacterium]
MSYNTIRLITASFPLAVNRMNMKASNIYTLMSDQSYLSESLFKSPELFDIFPMSIYWKSARGVYLGRNLFAAEQMVFEQHESTLNKSHINNKTDFDLFDKKNADIFRKNDLAVLENHHKVFHFVEEMTLPSGEIYENVSVKRAIINKKNEPVGIFGCSVNINKFAQPDKSLEEILRDRMISELYRKIMLSMTNDVSISLIKEINMRLMHLISISRDDTELKKILLLTPREFECLCLLLKGFSAKNIGLFLNASHRTIEIHINHIKEKLDLVYKNDITGWFWNILTRLSQ